MQDGDAHETLTATVTLCFINEALFTDDPRYSTRFRLWDDDHRQLLTKDREIHLMDLSKFEMSAEQVDSPLQLDATHSGD